MNTTTAVALAIFIVTYILLFAIEKARPYIALASAFIFVIIGTAHLLDYSYSPLEALGEVDWNVLMMIAGTMGTVLARVFAQGGYAVTLWTRRETSLDRARDAIRRDAPSAALPAAPDRHGTRSPSA